MPGHERGLVIVTGASRGIGAQVARAMATAGYAIAVNYSKHELGAAAVVNAIVAAGGRAKAYRADVSVAHEIEALFAHATAELGVLQGLVNNAGITGGMSRVEAVSAEVLHDVFAVNVTGSFLCAREAVRRMSTLRGGPGGSIVNVSSRAAALGGPGEWVHYAASKAALDALTIGLAKEVAKEGIRVNAVAPGLIDTELHAAAGDAGRLERLAPTIPLGRAGSCEDVAAAVTWLFGDQASYITGAILPVSGGR